MPDIDLDFPRDIREKLIVRVTERYGHEHASLVAAFSTYHSRGAIRDLGKALGLPFAELERLARVTEGNPHRVAEEVAKLPGDHTSSRWRALGELAHEIGGLPRHISQHPGGMVISSRPLVELVPVQPAAMEGRQICQWDKDSCADAGFLKIDLLGLGMLSAVEDCVDQIARLRGEPIDLSRIPLDDQAVYEEIQRADTVGDFQIESRAQMQSLLRTRPENLDDLTIQVALVRPGPIQGGAVHPYIERRQKRRENPDFVPPVDHPSLAEPLRETLGVVVFQDQVLEVAMALAGFTVGEAEALRRAMSRKRSEEAIEALRPRFVEGALRQGVDEELANRVYDKLVGFSGFGFPKSHSAAFALLAYQSAWLRHHYPGRVPLRAPERAADGLLPAGEPRPRRPATRGGGASAGREPERGDLCDRGRRRARRARLRPLGRRRGGEGGRGGAAVRRRRRSRPPRAGEQGSAGDARRLGRLRPVRPAPRAALAGRRRAAPAERGRRQPPAGARARADRARTRPASADGLGADARRLRHDRPLDRPASAGAAPPAPPRGDALQPRAP